MVGIVTTWQLRTIRAVVFATLCVAMSATAHLSMSEAGIPGWVLLAAFAGTAAVTWLLAGQRRGPAVISAWMIAAQTCLHLLFERGAPMSTGASAAAGASGQAHGALDWTRLLLCTSDGIPNGVQPLELARAAGLDPAALSAAGLPPYGPDSAVQATQAIHLHGGAAGLTDPSAMSQAMPGMPAGSGSVGGSVGALSESMAPSMAHGLSTGMLLAHLLAGLACALLLWRGEAAVAGLFQLVRTLAAVLVPLLLLFVPRSPEPSVPGPAARRRTGQPRSVLLTHAVVRRGPPVVLAVPSARLG
ncbi:hypothetical protein [Saccharothrix sp. ST-888]|uniref:hypothetical protein n=1 Tax=Saccharothrix sp. ST-888 TaxID=1427391 RepID=UPI0005ED005A|nr:hypothetical protein [Saccharothrix sp. ST-888]KJK56502.1 hypothetical protein UK12_22215 [Saccharothrix sp. ST-888]